MKYIQSYISKCTYSTYIFVIASTVKLQLKEPPVTIPVIMCLKKVTSNKRNAETGGGVCVSIPTWQTSDQVHPALNGCCLYLGGVCTSFSKPGNAKCSPLLKQYQSSLKSSRLHNIFIFFYPFLIPHIQPRDLF